MVETGLADWIAGWEKEIDNWVGTMRYPPSADEIRSIKDAKISMLQMTKEERDNKIYLATEKSSRKSAVTSYDIQVCAYPDTAYPCASKIGITKSLSRLVKQAVVRRITVGAQSYYETVYE